MLRLLEDTGFFNASLYTPFSIAGIETLGYEVAEDMRRIAGRDPDMVVVTHAGGGNLTGTVRGLRRAGADHTQVVAASVDLATLHMASDRDFNRKSFTTGHTGFGVPFAMVPDRSDVPRNAARALRYMERYVTVTQGEVFYTTEMLAQMEGLERGPAGNTALAAAVSLARELDQDQVLVVQETEYTGAGKHPTAQLSFAKKMGVEVRVGDPRQNYPGKVVVIPEDISQLSVQEIDVPDLRARYLRSAVAGVERPLEKHEVEYLAAETNSSQDFVLEKLKDLKVPVAN
jgi:2-amino-4-ketopentanoate thiolase beta subunit